MGLRAVRVAEDDYRCLAELLAENNLLAGGLDGDNKQFYAFVDDSGWRVGVGGFELFGDVALLRSFLTVATHRGQGLGAQMLEELLTIAAQQGVRHVYLFTEQAAEFFEKSGFDVSERADAPPVLRENEQFRRHCTDGTFMQRALTVSA